MASRAVERYLLEFNDALVAGAERRERILAEVEEHLRDATESIMAGGMTAAEAQLEAVARFGEPSEAAQRFGSDPLGRAQQAARWWEAQRIAHPVLAAVLPTSPWIALAAWTQLTFLPLFALGMFFVQIAGNRRVRRNAQAGVRPPAREPSARRPAWTNAPVVIPAVAWAASIGLSAMALEGTTTWFQIIWVTYCVCGVAAWASRLSSCADPACGLCGSRWVQRHPAAAAGVRYAAWTLALAGPGLAAILPATAGHTATALMTLSLYVALAPLPNRRSQRWLWARRPAIQVAVRGAPLLVLFAIGAAQQPAFWTIAVVVAVLVIVVQLEVRRSRARNAATRRHLVDRIGDNAAGLNAPATEG